MNVCDFKCRLKNAWKSLTVWFNTVFSAAVLAFSYFADSYMMLRDYLTPGTFQVLVLVAFVGNILLRFRTTKDLKDK